MDAICFSEEENMENYDVFSVVHTAHGYYVTKNGELFLSCSGGAEEAKKIAKTLNDDVQKDLRK
jgi:outer membrane protease